MIEDAKRVIAQTQAPWDELRERRVLGRIELALAARQSARPSSTSRGTPAVRKLWVAAGLALTLAAAVLLFVASPTLFNSDPATSTADLVAAAGEDTAAAGNTLPVIPDAHDPPAGEPNSYATAYATAYATGYAAADVPRLSLPDGSLAELYEGAVVDIELQSDDLVRLVQSKGRVRYTVTPNPSRRFVVDAVGVEVRVLGTIFVVTVEAQTVRVAVERGKVQVDGGEHVATLVAGEEIRVEQQDTPQSITTAPKLKRSPAGKQRASKPAPRVSIASAAELLRQADNARATSDLVAAATALGALVRNYPKDSRVYSGYFQLGKVERARKHHAAAASAFSACYKRAPAGALSEDARAEAAASWLAAQRPDRALKVANAYLERHPAGAHADRMRRIVAQTQ